jgi:hypothetical protein
MHHQFSKVDSLYLVVSLIRSCYDTAQFRSKIDSTGLTELMDPIYLADDHFTVAFFDDKGPETGTRCHISRFRRLRVLRAVVNRDYNLSMA